MILTINEISAILRINKLGEDRDIALLIISWVLFRFADS